MWQRAVEKAGNGVIRGRVGAASDVWVSIDL
jgi:hypothetical protein